MRYIDFRRRYLRPVKGRLRKFFHERVPGTTNLQPGDVLLASFPKSGNTFLRFLLANVELGLAGDDRIVHFKEINTSFKDVYETGETGSYEYKTLPRMVKTHMPRQYCPVGKRRSVLLIRHPGDVMVSYHKYRAAHKHNARRDQSLSEFIRHPDYGLPGWVEHTLSWRHKNTIAISYERLNTDTFNTLMEVFSKLNVTIRDSRIVQEAVEKSKFKRVQKLENKHGHDEQFSKVFASDAKFARSGISGEWQALFSADDVSYAKNQLSLAGLEPLWSADC